MNLFCFDNDLNAFNRRNDTDRPFGINLAVVCTACAPAQPVCKYPAGFCEIVDLLPHNTLCADQTVGIGGGVFSFETL